MKPIMRREDAPFGGEISGHYFFRDFYYADSGLAAMVAGLDYLSGQAEPLSRLVDQIDVYAHAAEINSTVQDIPNVLTNLKRHYADGHLDEVDGITIEYADWWFNARASNTEPLLRLTVEAKTRPMMEQKRDEVLNIIRRG